MKHLRKSINSFALNLSSALLEFSSLLTQTDFMSNTRAQRYSAHNKILYQDSEIDSIANEFKQRDREAAEASTSQWLRDRMNKKWPKVVACVYFASIVHILTSLYHQYVYDLCLLKLEKGLTSSQAQKLVLSAQTELFRRRLELIGAPFVESHFVSECFCQSLIFNSALYYLLPRFLFARTSIVPRDFGLPRRVMQLSNERRWFCEFLHEFINTFLDNKRRYTFNLECFYKNQRRQLSPSLRAAYQAKLNKRQFNLITTTKLIRLMVERDYLTPYTYTQDWVDSMRVLFAYSYMFVLLGSLLAAGLNVPMLLDKTPRLNLIDCVLLLEMLFLVLLVSLCVTILVTLLIMSSVEQLILCAQISACIESTIELNSRREQTMMALAEAATLDSNEEPQVRTLKGKVRAQMNYDLLCTLLKYKIFVAQLKPLLRTNGFLILCATIAMNLYPLDCLIHLSYVNARNQPSFKLAASAFSSTMLISALAGFALGCDLLVRGKRLFKRMISLLAHTVDVTAAAAADTAHGDDSSSNFNGPIYDQHTLDVLRREVEHPEMVAHLFSYEYLNLRCTWPNTMRAYFWVSILLVYFCVDNRDTNPVIGSILKDPLALLS